MPSQTVLICAGTKIVLICVDYAGEDHNDDDDDDDGVDDDVF